MPEFVLKNRNYLLLFLGSVVSNLGTQIYNFSMSLYILYVTGGNAAAAGIYMAFGGIVYFGLSPFGGAIVDRLDKVKVVYITDFISGITIVLAGLIILSGVSTTVIIVTLYISSFVLGVNGTLFNPSASSLPAHILEEKQLQQASSLQQGAFALYGIVGVALGGLAYSFLPIEYIFIINGVSFILSGVSESFISISTREEEEPHELTLKGTIVDIKDGLKYLRDLKPILYLVLVASMLNFFTTPVVANGLPYLFEIELEAEPFYFSILMAIFPIGIIISSLLLGTSAQKDRVSPIIRKGWLGMTLFFALFAVGTYLHLEDIINFFWFMVVSCITILFTGFFNGFVNAPFSVAIMKTVEKDKMGRIMSVIGVISNGLTPISIGLAGYVIDYIGLMELFYFAVGAMFITTIMALRNKYIGQL